MNRHSKTNLNSIIFTVLCVLIVHYSSLKEIENNNTLCVFSSCILLKALFHLLRINIRPFHSLFSPTSSSFSCCVCATFELGCTPLGVGFSERLGLNSSCVVDVRVGWRTSRRILLNHRMIFHMFCLLVCWCTIVLIQIVSFTSKTLSFQGCIFISRCFSSSCFLMFVLFIAVRGRKWKTISNSIS